MFLRSKPPLQIPLDKAKRQPLEPQRMHLSNTSIFKQSLPVSIPSSWLQDPGGWDRGVFLVDSYDIQGAPSLTTEPPKAEIERRASRFW
jgi:hypothetical protein